MSRGQKAILAALLCAFLAPEWQSARAQDDEILLPDQSAAKAKQLLQEAIDAMGGSAYIDMRDVTCTGKLSGFDHSGQLTGYETFIDYEQPPFKERQENLPKRNIISVFNGDKGWELDRGGVSEAPAADLRENVENVKVDLFNILKNRIHEKDMLFRYAGPDILDGWEADWVELTDSDNRTIRIGIARKTHLPVRKTVEERDPKTRTKSMQVEYYSNYHPIDGVQTPFQMTRERNQIKIFQAFFDKCQYNTGLSDALFTKESLDQRWDQVKKKEKPKKDKGDKNKDDKDDSDDKS
jgi:hypothetical protein